MGTEFSLKVADADQYRLMVAGVAINNGPGQSGYADGEFLTISQPKDGFVIVEGTDGSVARGKTNTRIVEISIKLLQTSASNAILSALHALDVNTPNGAGVGSFVLQDMQGTTLVLCTKCWVRKQADISLDRSATTREWMLHGLYSVYLVGGN